MKRGLKPSNKQVGFTIVETLIVLAVTGLLFVAIASSFSGRQAKAEFANSIQDIRSQIQQTIDEVANGYFPSSAGFKCTSDVTGTHITTLGGGSEQGTNDGCVFLGKVMQFNTTATVPQPFSLHTVAGARVTQYTDLPGLNPVYVAPIAENKQIKNGLNFVKMKYSGGNADSVGFLYSLGKREKLSDGSPGSAYANGSPQVDVYVVTDTNFTGKMSNYALVDDSQGVQLCFKGGSGRYGKITVGGQLGTSATSLQITDQADCGL